MAKGTPSDASMYGITRRALDWNVRLVRDGVRHDRTFSFLVFGGQAQALQAAQAWRDLLVRTNPPVSRRERASRLRSTNSSGIAGVSLQYDRHGEPLLWLASTYIGPGQVLRRAFSIRRWGADARRLAIKAREQQLAQMHGLAKVHPAEDSLRLADPPPPPRELPAQLPRSAIPRRNNRSSVPGVVRRAGRGHHLGYWTAQTMREGRATSKSFSVSEYGEEGAKALAIDERERQLAWAAQAVAYPAAPSSGRRLERMRQDARAG